MPISSIFQLIAEELERDPDGRTWDIADKVLAELHDWSKDDLFEELDWVISAVIAQERQRRRRAKRRKERAEERRVDYEDVAIRRVCPVCNAAVGKWCDPFNPVLDPWIGRVHRRRGLTRIQPKT